MKKKFKTIMALTAALAILISGNMVLATSEEIPYDKETGEFDVKQIGISMTVVPKYAVTIEYGDFKLVFEEGQLTGASLASPNNEIKVTNNSDVSIVLQYTLSIKDESEAACLSDFGFYLANETGASICTDSNGTTYSDAITLNPTGTTKTSKAYLSAKNTTSDEMGQYHFFDNTSIGYINVKLSPSK